MMTLSGATFTKTITRSRRTMSLVAPGTRSLSRIRCNAKDLTSETILFVG